MGKCKICGAQSSLGTCLGCSTKIGASLSTIAGIDNQDQPDTMVYGYMQTGPDYQKMERENEIHSRNLGQLEKRIWELDIPSPTIPEYVELHEKMQELVAMCQKWKKEISNA